MRDVAREAGVSVKTVSRVHNDDPHVSAETRERVEEAISRLGYLPNTLATTFRDGRSAVVGVVVPSIEDPYFAAIVHQVDRTAALHGMLTIVAGTGADPVEERERVETLLSRRLSGLVLAPVSEDQSYLTPWAGSTPLVLVDRQPTRLTADSFTTDDAGGAAVLTEHLLSHGHRRIAFLGDTPRLSTTADRLAGYLRALADAGVDARPDLVAMADDDPGGVDGVLDALTALDAPPTALVSSNARCTQALAPRLRTLGLAVVSFGDFPLSDALVPSVTVLDQQPRLVGELAAARVIDRHAHPGRRFRRRTTVPAVLVERDSCRGEAPGTSR
ncbi:LacI family DNA-binding transcriptional regulator [Oerskovia flava]|uniref:LacI family DNA-binding transcriptional regulator n=1 Tax=Oerskovia flava TaxID=2986422 RepID=UPI00223F267E|nr:LacI family DNA-binding transcriptional regulator [Oerskovia sp. JB1-3-2]